MKGAETITRAVVGAQASVEKALAKANAYALTVEGKLDVVSVEKDVVD